MQSHYVDEKYGKIVIKKMFWVTTGDVGAKALPIYGKMAANMIQKQRGICLHSQIFTHQCILCVFVFL